LMEGDLADAVRLVRKIVDLDQVPPRDPGHDPVASEAMQSELGPSPPKRRSGSTRRTWERERPEAHQRAETVPRCSPAGRDG
jgi:hypothetical protein